MRLNAVEAGAPEAEPVVLLHGLFGQARNLGRLQRRLADLGRIVAIDLRSHGTSPAGALDLRAMGADVEETMRSLGLGPAAVIGHSLGGKVAMALALDHPDATLGILVADIAPAGYRHGHGGLVEALRALDLSPGLTRAGADAALAVSVADPSVRALLLQNLRTGTRPGWTIGLDEIAASLDQAEGWPAWPDARFEGPAWFVRGERSDYVLPDHWEGIRALFPHAVLKTVPDAGHWLHVDQPDAFAAIARAFIGAAGR